MVRQSDFDGARDGCTASPVLPKTCLGTIHPFGLSTYSHPCCAAMDCSDSLLANARAEIWVCMQWRGAMWADQSCSMELAQGLEGSRGCDSWLACRALHR